MEEPRQKFFNVYDPSASLRQAIDKACKAKDLSRSQFVRHAIRDYLAKHEAG